MRLTLSIGDINENFTLEDNKLVSYNNHTLVRMRHSYGDNYAVQWHKDDSSTETFNMAIEMSIKVSDIIEVCQQFTQKFTFFFKDDNTSKVSINHNSFKANVKRAMAEATKKLQAELEGGVYYG